ncbi:MAG TPA: DHH family phosphoesterase [Verrucomicrobiota bacterium]|mgnify:CR=1 FL=1|jgi:hypothetical protein|nr:DHH family phosphoesterase [Verrucomicrobiota bacterium]OQC66393.1 MAG: hypothetical protein BWX48_01628 [Verrucomicrobia bacterium ADurb.Bin006]NMD21678.1 DHH family phosphoesterase [Verrucomicrobiota bacterium]HNU99361.1 DHH family phosphoesterase [Verrucomicrobiota bacterium]HOA61989.1 DHH family phosphoesterase [Verrucomicrobiota bacterium]
MSDLPKPALIITHESDLDGLVSGVLLQRLARRLFGVEVPLLAYHNHAWRQRPLPESAAWVCDLGFDKRLDRPGWLVVDHHEAEAVPQKARLIMDPGKSAGLLAYDLCRQHGLESPALDRLVHLNNVADLFLVDDPEFDLANDYASLVKVYQFWNLHALIGGELERLVDHPLLEVMAAKRRIENPLGFEWSRTHVSRLSDTVGYVDTIVGNSNLIVHQLLNTQATPYTVLLTLLRQGNGTVVASLRSRNGEALKIAACLQGGGHPNAAGATLPRSVQRIPDAIAYLAKVLVPQPPASADAGGLESLFVGGAGAGTDRTRKT